MPLLNNSPSSSLSEEAAERERGVEERNRVFNTDVLAEVDIVINTFLMEHSVTECGY
jgi:hypothetical protein